MRETLQIVHKVKDNTLLLQSYSFLYACTFTSTMQMMEDKAARKGFSKDDHDKVTF